jgi:nicotinate-nucleotide pyrophosphorylase (carboxylating)
VTVTEPSFVPLNPTVVKALRAGGLDPAAVGRLAALAVAEDLAYGPDITTTSVVSPQSRASGQIRARKAGVAAGVAVAAAVFEAAASLIGEGDGGLGAGVSVELLVSDGSRVAPGEAVVAIEGPARIVLQGERTALNLLCHLSGVATLTRQWVDAVASTGAAIRDTRKTMPGLRALEKFAVRCGGGVNHRMGLGDAALIKDNHVAAAGGVIPALEAVRAAYPEAVIEVECDTLDQVAEALSAGASLILLDNMEPGDLRAAVALAAQYPNAQLEASGGLDLDGAPTVAATGVHFLAVGALTHSAPALDFGLDFDSPLR